MPQSNSPVERSSITIGSLLHQFLAYAAIAIAVLVIYYFWGEMQRHEAEALRISQNVGAPAQSQEHKVTTAPDDVNQVTRWSIQGTMGDFMGGHMAAAAGVVSFLIMFAAFLFQKLELSQQLAEHKAHTAALKLQHDVLKKSEERRVLIDLQTRWETFFDAKDAFFVYTDRESFRLSTFKGRSSKRNASSPDTYSVGTGGVTCSATIAQVRDAFDPPIWTTRRDPQSEEHEFVFARIRQTRTWIIRNYMIRPNELSYDTGAETIEPEQHAVAFATSAIQVFSMCLQQTEHAFKSGALSEDGERQLNGVLMSVVGEDRIQVMKDRIPESTQRWMRDMANRLRAQGVAIWNGAEATVVTQLVREMPFVR